MAKEPTLYARMELRLTDAEKRLARFQSTVDRSMGAMEKRTASASARMQKLLSGAAIGVSTAFTAAGVAAVAGLAVMFSLTAKAKDALDEFGNIADKSMQSGLDSEFFQELAYGASLAGVGMDELSSSLNTFSKNAGLAVVGKGKMVAALQKLNPALLENIRNAADQEERIKLAADAIDEAKTASEKAALATTLFGNAGAALVPVFNGGATAIDQFAQKAQALGIVVDRDLIARADQLGDEFDTASKAISIQFQSALVELAPILVSTARLAADVARAISGIIASFGGLDAMSDKALATRKVALIQENAALAKSLSENRAAISDLEEKAISPSTALDLDSSVRADTANDLMGLRDTIEESAKRRAELRGEIADIEKMIQTRKEASQVPIVKPDDTSDLPPIPPPGGSTRNKAADDALRQAEAVRDLIADLQFEQSTIGKSQAEIAKMTALRTAGSAATAEQRAQIVALIDATAAEQARLEATKQTMDELKSSSASFLTTFRQGLVSGESAAKSFQSALLQLLDSVATKLEQLAIDKLFASFLGTATGGLGSVLGISSGGTSGYFPPAPSAPAQVKVRQPSAAIGASNQNNVHVTVGLKKNGLNIEPEVIDVATRVGKVGLDKYRRGDLHEDIKRHAGNPRVKGR